jgi:hypothetical protein
VVKKNFANRGPLRGAISSRADQRLDLDQHLGHKIVSTKSLTPGFYLCKFVVNGIEKQTIKLSVIK